MHSLTASLLMQVFFSVILGSFSLGNALPELETFGTAMGAASFIFKTIDRVGVGRGRGRGGEGGG